jgi:hypothetical protein
MQVTERQSNSANSLFKTYARVWTVNQPSAQCIDDPDGVMFPVHCAANVQHYSLFILEKKSLTMVNVVVILRRGGGGRR